MVQRKISAFFKQSPVQVAEDDDGQGLVDKREHAIEETSMRGAPESNGYRLLLLDVAEIPLLGFCA